MAKLTKFLGIELFLIGSALCLILAVPFRVSQAGYPITAIGIFAIGWLVMILAATYPYW